MTSTQQSEVDDIVAHLTRVATQARDPNVLVPLKNGHYLGIRFDQLLAALATLRPKVVPTTQPCDQCGTAVAVNAVSFSECFCSYECLEAHGASQTSLRPKVSEAEVRSVKERLRANAVHCLSDAERRTLATECLDLFDRLKGEKA